MGRAKGAKNQQKHKPPEEQHQALTVVKKLICYNYWLHIRTEKKEGWDPEKAGYKIHWQQSQSAQKAIAEGSFYRVGQVSSFGTPCY